MTDSTVQTPEACRQRATVMAEDAGQLRALPNQWYAVSYFYAAYHTVRAALLEDPVFSDFTRLKSYGEHWTPDDRWAAHHQARKTRGVPNAPGVNDLVKMLYPKIAVDYVLLHGASIAVRYGLGAHAYDPEALANAYATITAAGRSGELRAR